MRKKSDSHIVELKGVKPRPMVRRIKHKDGSEEILKLNDAQVVANAVKVIDEYVKENKSLPAGVDGKFVQWLRETNDAVKGGENIVEHKQTTVSRTVSDYRDLQGVTD